MFSHPTISGIKSSRSLALALLGALCLPPILAGAAPASAIGVPPPRIQGDAERFSDFGAPVVISGSSVPGIENQLFLDPRGPARERFIAGRLPDSNGRFSFDVVLDNDFRAVVRNNGGASRQVLLFATPRVASDTVGTQRVRRPAGPFLERGAQVLETGTPVGHVIGRGAPGSTFQIFFRRLGTASFSISQTLRVDDNGFWYRPLRMEPGWSFFLRRTKTAPISPVYVLRSCRVTCAF